MTDYLDQHDDLNDPRLASILDELSLWSAHFGMFLLDNIEMKHGLNVLDLGCGNGFPLFELAQRLGATGHVTGIDVWEASLMRARLKQEMYQLKNVSLIETNGTHFPCMEDQFDLIVCNLGINNFEQPKETLHEVHRVAKSGAKFVLTTNPKGHMQEFYKVFRTVLIEANHPLDKLKDNENHRGTEESLRDLLVTCGFNITRVLHKSFTLRYLDGSAFLRHFFIRIGFLPAWRAAVEPAREREIFTALEHRLNEVAAQRGELRLTIPMLYAECVTVK